MTSNRISTIVCFFITFWTYTNKISPSEDDPNKKLSQRTINFSILNVKLFCNSFYYININGLPESLSLRKFIILWSYMKTEMRLKSVMISGWNFYLR